MPKARIFISFYTIFYFLQYQNPTKYQRFIFTVFCYNWHLFWCQWTHWNPWTMKMSSTLRGDKNLQCHSVIKLSYQNNFNFPPKLKMIKSEKCYFEDILKLLHWSYYIWITRINTSPPFLNVKFLSTTHG